MQGKFSTFAKGVGAGTVIGMAVIAGGSMLMNNSSIVSSSRSFRKKLSHAAKSAGTIMNNVSSMLK